MEEKRKRKSVKLMEFFSRKIPVVIYKNNERFASLVVHHVGTALDFPQRKKQSICKGEQRWKKQLSSKGRRK